MVRLSIKLIFVAGTFLKSPEQPIFAGKTVFLEFLELYFIFFHEILHTDENGNVQNVTEPDFRKTYFSGRKCRKYAGKTGFFWHFLEISSFVFLDFLLKDAY